MAAINPSAVPLNENEPMRATLKLLRRPIDPDEFMNDDYEDSDQESEEDSDNEEDGDKGSGGTSKAKKKADAAIKKALRVAEANAMEVDAKNGLNEDEDEDSDDEFAIEEFVICTLDAEKHYQQTLDIVLREEEDVYFKVDGNYRVSLTGYYAVSSNQNMPDDDYSEGDEEDSDFDLSPGEDELVGMLDELDDESDELDNVDTPRITEINSDDDKKAGKKLNKAEKKSLKRGAEDEPKAEEPKLSKKQQKKLKANDGKAVEASADTPEKKKVQFAKGLEQGPTNSQKDKKTLEKTPEKSPGKAAAAGPSKKVVQGITIEDKKAGSGPAARNGQKLGMRYIGKLDNGQVFDSNTKGKPFTFRLGKGEVIKGWDIGLAGMQVGGERRVIVPANMAYGKKGVPGIPGNSTLTFDVKLLEIK